MNESETDKQPESPPPEHITRRETAPADPAGSREKTLSLSKLDLIDVKLTSTPTSPVSPGTQIHIQRAVSCTEAWKPAINRRHSYKKEDLKHELQMALICDIKTGPGFSEKL